MPARKKTSANTKKEKKTVKKVSSKKVEKKETKKKPSIAKKKTSQTKKNSPKTKTKDVLKKETKKKESKTKKVKPKRHHLEVKTLTKSSLVEPEIKEIETNDSLGFETDLKEEEINREIIDSQKKFYKELSNELDQDFLENDLEEKEDEKREAREIKTKKSYRARSASVGLYKKLARLFLFLTAILLLAVVYFSFSKLTITINSAEEIINNNVLLDIYNNSEVSDSLSGSVMSITAKSEGLYKATGQEIIGEEIVGKVTIINNYTKDQPLIATTRLLTQDDKLYRIKNSVDVPAGGSVEVEIYADEIKAEMAIGPSKFIIPGLWSGLQDRIYAESKEKFVYQTKVENYVKSSDISRAQEDLKAKLLEDVEKEASRMFNNNDQVIYDVNASLTKFEYNVKTGTKKNDFDMSAESQVVVVAFPKELAKDLARNKLSLLIPQDKEIKDFDPNSLIYTLDNYNLRDGVATIKVSFSGKMSLRGNADIVDRKQLVNLKREQIEQYLNNFSEIQSFELKFFPSFVKKAPYLPEKIEIEVE